MELLRTDRSVTALLLRLALGIVIFPHGAQKVFGWFGGYGLHGTLNFFTQTMGIPVVFAVLAIAAEFLGSLGLVTGLLTRVAAFAVAVEMLVAVALVHLHNGFFMNWSGAQKGEGFEFHLLAIGIAIALMIKGGGAASIDGALAGEA